MHIGKAFIISSGDGVGMNSKLPCALHEVCGRRSVEWVYQAAYRLADETVIAADMHEEFASRCEGRKVVGLNCPLDSEGYALLLRADMPLVSTDTMTALIDAANGHKAAFLCIYDEEDVLDIKDVCCVRKDVICGHTAGESIAELMDSLGEEAVRCTVARWEKTRIVDRASLWECEFMAQARINAKHFKNGVTLIDPHRIYISADAVIGRDTILYPNTMLIGRCAIGEDCRIFDSRLIDTAIGDGCELKNVVAERAAVGSGVKIGPFVNLRPDTVIADGCKIGDFVEVKNSNIGRGTKLPHLSYIGDADVGERVNVGCGSVFVNYDGIEKFRTTVGNDVFIGCQSNLVAPVKVGDGAYTAAGSTITEDVPEDSLAIARARQETKPGWVKKYYALRGKKHRGK